MAREPFVGGPSTKSGKPARTDQNAPSTCIREFGEGGWEYRCESVRRCGGHKGRSWSRRAASLRGRIESDRHSSISTESLRPGVLIVDGKDLRNSLRIDQRPRPLVIPLVLQGPSGSWRPRSRLPPVYRLVNRRSSTSDRSPNDGCRGRPARPIAALRLVRSYDRLQSGRTGVQNTSDITGSDAR